MQKVSIERRRFILRTAEKEDAVDYAYLMYDGHNEGVQRRKECEKIEQQIEKLKDTGALIAIRTKDNRFVGFIFSKPVSTKMIQFIDIVIPREFGLEEYAEDCIKQFSKGIIEGGYAKVISFLEKGSYSYSNAERYIEDFLQNYEETRCVMAV